MWYLLEKDVEAQKRPQTTNKICVSSLTSLQDLHVNFCSQRKGNVTRNPAVQKNIIVLS